MTRSCIIVLFVVGVLSSGCQTDCSNYSPAAWAAWQKCCKVKEGMTYSQVYAILPPTGRFPGYGSEEMEDWLLGCSNIGQDHVMMHVVYGKNGRVIHIDRSIDHGIPIAPEPTLIKVE